MTGMPWLHAVLDVPAQLHEQQLAFWSQALGWDAGAPWDGHPELRSFDPVDGDAYVHLQRIEGAPRVHLDVETSETGEAVVRARGLGARVVDEHDRWTTLASPGGLAFCLVASSEHRTPDPVAWPGGHRARLVQVCIDAPASAHDREVGFWRAFLPGRWADSPAREFAGKWHDDAGSPLQLLFQRLDQPDGTVRAHLDHGTDDLGAEVRRLLDLGADDVGPGHGGWHTLRDPAGLAFCVTGNSPAATPRREIG